MKILKAQRFIILIVLIFFVSCSNKKNTFLSRNYHALTTHYNVYFNGKESLKAGKKKIKTNSDNNYTQLLPIFEYENLESRTSSFGDMDGVINKATKAIKLHSITRKPKRKKGDKTAKYIAFRKKREYNNWIDDCYLLLAEGEFYKKDYMKSEKHYKFILKQFPKSDLRVAAKIGIARCYVDKGRGSQAIDMLSRIGSGSKLSKQQREEIYALSARVSLMDDNYQSCISNLNNALLISNNKATKARYYYIIAQLYMEQGNKNMAVQTFNSLIKLNPDYAMVFNAKISSALAYSSNEDGDAIKANLMKMLKDRKNLMFKDQIFYALAEMNMIDNDEKSAIENYWNSTRLSFENDNQKALSFLKLGDIYFNKSVYKKAQMCYDSSMVYLAPTYNNYAQIADKVSKLSELVVNLNAIEHQDSLQMVASLPKKQRDKIINSIIKEITDRENEEIAEKNQSRMDKNFYMRNNMMGGRNRSSTNKRSGGNWYFYNPTTVGMGKSEFKRKWGRRKLEDNWRRKSRAILLIIDEDEDEEEIIDIIVLKKGNPKQASYYNADLPMTKEALAESDKIIMKSLYNAGIVYQEKLEDYNEAASTFAILIARFPNNPYLLSTYYRSYILHSKLNNQTKASYYSDIIIKKYPDSEYSKALLDPLYYDKLDAENLKIESIYADVYSDFQNYYYHRVINKCDQTLKQYSKNDLKARFSYLRAMAIGKTESSDKFVSALEDLLKQDLPLELKATSESILKSIQEGASTIIFSKADMQLARHDRLTRNWRFNSPRKENLIIEEKTKAEKKIIKTVFNSDISGKQYFVIYFANDDLKSSKLVFDLTAFNVDNFDNRTFDIDTEEMPNGNVMVVVKGLNDKKDAISYFNKIVRNEDVFRDLKEIEYKNFLLSEKNFIIFKKSDDIASYLPFYTKAYFNATLIVPKSKVKEQQTIKNNSLERKKESVQSKEFIYSPAENHKLILLAPRKGVNIKDLRNRMYNHDKDYEVITEKFDDDYNIIEVNNIGRQSEAVDYLLKILKNKDVYAELQDIKFYNFIISDSNFSKFQEHKNLDEYLSFFKKHYVPFMTKSYIPKKEIKSIYKLDKEAVHYFAIAYEKAKVNIEVLREVIEKYNRGTLEVDIKTLDTETNILLVGDMKNKKQSLMYYRAFLTNPKLLVPLKKAEYSYFVISAENLKTLQNDKNLPLYFYFFKYSYLQ